MAKKFKRIPKFKNEGDEAEFWNTHSSVDYIDWSKAKQGIFPNLKPSSRSISIRLPESIINEVKVEANRLDMPYQALMKQYIARAVKKDRQKQRV